VQPIVTPERMRAIDAAAAEPTEVLVQRAGAAVARSALRMMGGAYGRTVHVIAGKGNNGADGRVAGSLLAAKGVRVIVHDAEHCPPVLPAADLVIDAAYGTGFRGTWSPPAVGDTPVLAVDIPSGVNALTGQIEGEVLTATHTVTFAAWKFGLLNPPGSDVTGTLELVDIGLPVDRADAFLVEASDVREWWPVPYSDSHKWRTAVRIVAGSSTMPGAATLASTAAMRSGAGIVHLSAPGCLLAGAPTEVVQRPLPTSNWAAVALDSLSRFQSLVVGPGLGREPHQAEQVRHIVVSAEVPTVVDGDGLFAMAWNASGAQLLLRQRRRATVLTPHDGEYAMLSGEPPDPDRLVAARRLAADTGCVVLLKGPATVVAEPHGHALVVATGDVRLATAGTGDVLSGIIGRLLAGGVEPLHAAAAAAWVHGMAGRRGPRVGLVAGDLPALVSDVLAEVL